MERYTSPTGQHWDSAGPDWVGPQRHRLAGNYFVKIVPDRCRAHEPPQLTL